MENKEKDRKRLSTFVDKQVRLLQKKVLDISELVVPAANYSTFRSKILGITNDFRRELEKELELNYTIKFDPKIVCEDIVEVTNFKGQPLVFKERKGEGNGN